MKNEGWEDGLEAKLRNIRFCLQFTDVKRWAIGEMF